MKYFYIIREYIGTTFKCFKYFYQFDKKGSIARLCVFITIPIVGNLLMIANAKLTDNMQASFGTGIMSLLLPIFIVVIGIQVIEEIVKYIKRALEYSWRTRMTLILESERQFKKAEFSVPFIDSKDWDELNQRIGYSGGMSAQLDLVTTIPDFFSIIINLAFATYIVGSFNPLYALIICIAALPSLGSAFKHIFGSRKLEETNLDFNRYTGVYGNQFANWTEFKDIKASGSWKRVLDIYVSRRKETLVQRESLYRKHIRINLFTNLIGLATGFIIQYLVLQGTVDGSILIGYATLVIMKVFNLQNLIRQFAWFLPAQYTGVIGAKYLFLYLETLENVERQKGTEFTFKNDYIEIRDLKFKYPFVELEDMKKMNKQIEDFGEKYFNLPRRTVAEEDKKKNDFTLTIKHLEIKRGERVAIVGKNGNGKTTFIQLILNLYKSSKGEILVFGNNTRDVSQPDIQKQYSILFQDFGNVSLKAHEYMGLSEIDSPDMERVKAAAKLAGADEFIEKWKDGYTQQLGIAYKGVKPSKGQWQKLALARTFYKDAPIIILDEPTAAIDAISAKKIFENLSKIDKEKILIFVSHNISDVPLAATRVLVFDQGKIVGDGPHDELLKTCAVYKELYDSEKGA